MFYVFFVKAVGCYLLILECFFVKAVGCFMINIASCNLLEDNLVRMQQNLFQGIFANSLKAVGSNKIALSSFWCKIINDVSFFKLTLILPCDVKNVLDQVLTGTVEEVEQGMSMDEVQALRLEAVPDSTERKSIRWLHKSIFLFYFEILLYQGLMLCLIDLFVFRQ